MINKRTIVVPKGIRYISEWGDYSLNLPEFQTPHILDKKIPGCGFTEYCLTSPMNIILCSPRKILLENKEQQHSDTVFYFKNDLESTIGCDKDLTAKVSHGPLLSKEELTKEQKTLILEDLKNQLRSYVTSCICRGIPCKILVTYDSFRLVKEFLLDGGRFNDFYVVVDEFQSVMVDAIFKSSTELDFLNQLNDVQKVCYVSATPMLEDYLIQIPEFKDLPYYELDWITADPVRAITPDLKVRVTQSITSVAVGIINSYLNSEFDKFSPGDGSIIESKEAVFYVNSVNNILSIIKKCGLTHDQCNILCADTYENKRKIRSKLGRAFSIGKVPLEGESHKMFTFCTRTVYLGADFYSKCARTFILSDANINSLTVDISLDLPQILGRQRLNENPWKNRAEFWYKTLCTKNKITKDMFDSQIQSKIESTNNLLAAWTSAPTDASKRELATVYRRDIDASNYKFNYVAVNERSGNTLIPCLNNLVRISEQRAFDIQQIDYKDRFTVFNTLRDFNMVGSQISESIELFKLNFESSSSFYTRMKLLCESNLGEYEICVILDQIPIQYKNYYLTLGPTRCKALAYNVTNIGKEYEDIINPKGDLIREAVYKSFIPGQRYTKADIKTTLKSIYETLGYSKAPKANDLEEYFEIKTCQIINKETGKKDMAFEIISKKL